MWRPTKPWLGERNASGTVPTIANPRLSQSLTAAVLLSTTALNWIPWYPFHGASRRRTRPETADAKATCLGVTMKLAVPMWSPGPGRLGPIFADPTIVSSVFEDHRLSRGGLHPQAPARLGREVRRVGIGLPFTDDGLEERPDRRPVLVGGLTDDRWHQPAVFGRVAEMGPTTGGENTLVMSSPRQSHPRFSPPRTPPTVPGSAR